LFVKAFFEHAKFLQFNLNHSFVEIVHRHALLMSKFTSPCSMFVCFSNRALSSNCYFSLLFKIW